MTQTLTTFRSVCVALLLALTTQWASAEVAVIVNPNAGIDSLSADDVKRLFLGKIKTFPNGTKAVPVNQNPGEATRKDFDSNVLNKSASQLKSYWSRLIFSGKGTPPKESGGNQDIIELVSTNPNIVGYVDAGAVNDSVKVVFTK